MALGQNLSKKTTETKPSVQEELQEENAAPVEVQETAKQVDKEEERERLNQFCVFRSGGEEYAIPINLVKEVVPYPKTSVITQMPRYIIGMANVRGNIFGVLDLGQFFSLNSKQASENNYLLVLEHDVYQMAIAIPDVPDTLLVSEKMIEKLSAARLKSALGQKYLKGIIKKDRRMIILFDILGMISGEKFTETS